MIVNGVSLLLPNVRKQDQSASTVNAANIREPSMGYAASLSIFLLLLEVCYGEFEYT